MGEVIAGQGELVGLCGWNGTTWEPVLIDGTKRLVIAIASSVLPTNAATSAKQLPDGHAVTVDNVSLAVTGAFYQVTQPISAVALPLPTLAATAAKQLAAGHDVTVDNANLSVLSGTDKIFGFESVVAEHKTDTDLGAGTNTLSMTACPTGKVQVLTSVLLQYTGTAPTTLVIQLIHDAVTFTVYRVPGVADPNCVQWSGHIYLDAGDYIRAAVLGATAGDDLVCDNFGYQMAAP